MNKCTACGCLNDDRFTLCGRCGTELPPAAVGQSASPPKPPAPESLNEEKPLWITEDQLGTVRTLAHRGRRVQYRLPTQIQDTVTLRFRGHGKTQGAEVGDLLLHVHVDRGQDTEAVLWLSRAQARAGCQKCLCECLMSVPAGSAEGTVVRVSGLGEKSPYRWGMPFFGRRRGDLRVILRVFADDVAASYRSADSLSTEDLVLEGWIYRRIDWIRERMTLFPLELEPFTAVQAADLFNENGWRAIAKALVGRLGLSRAPLSFEESPTLPVPGQCKRHIVTQYGVASVSRYEVSIRSDFLNNPFAVTAILAHELCHIVEARFLAAQPAAPLPTGQALTELERTVDLLVFLFQLGEFQMRVARESRMTLGYFDQEMFERMHKIICRKQHEWLRHLAHPPKPA